MLLAIDVGNTNIVFAVYDGTTKLNQWRLETSQDVTSILNTIKTSHSNIEGIIISSVVPDANEPLVQACGASLNLKAILVNNQNIDIVIDLDKPSEVGADRLVNAVAVINSYQVPAIVVDFGTATTFDVIDVNSAYAGGVIASGVNLSMKALYDATAQLPEIEIKKPANVIGKNTVSAMQSGVYWGYIGMVEGTIKRINQEMGLDKVMVIATGGLAPLFADGTDMISTIDQDLTLKGLVHLYKSMNHD